MVWPVGGANQEKGQIGGSEVLAKGVPLSGMGCQIEDEKPEYREVPGEDGVLDKDGLPDSGWIPDCGWGTRSCMGYQIMDGIPDRVPIGSPLPSDSTGWHETLTSHQHEILHSLIFLL